MAAKINPKNMDYFKFKKIVVDGNRDDYESCSREIRALCDSVQTLALRCVVFDLCMAYACCLVSAWRLLTKKITA
jgi:hypothetical protein